MFTKKCPLAFLPNLNVTAYKNNITIYYMALSHKDWELTNTRIWLAEIDIDRSLDFPINSSIETGYVLQWKLQKYWVFPSTNIFFLFYGSAKKHDVKKGVRSTSKLCQN